jgi:hypothetical protein
MDHGIIIAVRGLAITRMIITCNCCIAFKHPELTFPTRRAGCFLWVGSNRKSESYIYIYMYMLYHCLAFCMIKLYFKTRPVDPRVICLS